MNSGLRLSVLIGILLLTSQAAFAQAPVFEQGRQPPGKAAPSRAAIESYNAGVALLQANKPAEATAKFQQSLALSPDFVNAQLNLGTALMMQGDPQGALPQLKKAADAAPEMSAVWATLGSCYQALGQTQNALDAFQKYLTLAPHGALAAKVRALQQSLSVELKRTQTITTSDSDDYLAEATYGGLARWNKMPIRVLFNPAGDVPGYKSEYLDILKQALSDWEQASHGKISFDYVSDPAKAQITFTFTHSLRDAVTAAEGGHTVIVPDSKGGLVGANVSLLTVPLTGSELSSNYARRVDLHEIGHALGILGHSKNPDDIMFASVLPSNKNVSLTARDSKTLSMLYSDEALSIANKGIDTAKLVCGDPSSVVNRVLVLNNEAKVLMDNKDFPGAMSKLEQAKALEPNDPVVNTNLGSVYGNMALANMMLRNFSQAEIFFKRSIPLLEKGTGQMNLATIMKSYSRMLHMQNRAAEAAKIDARLTAMDVH